MVGTHTACTQVNNLGNTSCQPADSLLAVPAQATGEAKKLLNLCCSASDMIHSGRLYHAHLALCRIRNEHLEGWQQSADKARHAAACNSSFHG